MILSWFATRGLQSLAKLATFLFKVSSDRGYVKDMFGDGDDTVIKYAVALLSAASAQHGRHPATQIWTLRDAMPESEVTARLADELEGLRLRLGRELVVQDEVGGLAHPFLQQGQGMLQQSVHDEFLAWFIQCVQASTAAKDLLCNTVASQKVEIRHDHRRCVEGGWLRWLIRCRLGHP